MSTPLNMNSERSLSGRCQCGRNAYIINLPKNAREAAQVLFNSHPSHRVSVSTPLAAFLRVPIGWVHSVAIPFYPDESPVLIRRAYTHPAEQHAKRHFCGFCGTPLSFWSEQPPSEAEFLHIALGSLCGEDLSDLEELGMLPQLDEDDATEQPPAEGQRPVAARLQMWAGDSAADAGALLPAGRERRGLSWFDSLISGSRLGNLRTTRGSGESADGRIQLQWEVVEWTEGSGDSSPTSSGAKRKLGDRGEDEATDGMEDVQQHQ